MKGIRRVTHEESTIFAKEIFFFVLEDAIEWIRDTLAPEDVYHYDTLSQWALDNGFEEKE